MKNLFKTSLLLTFIAMLAAGCGQTTTSNTKKTSTSSSNPSTGTPNTHTIPTTPVDPGTIAGCNGVYRAGASRCYFTEIPKIQFNGTSLTASAVNNVQIWSSATGLPSSFSPNNFVTDGSFSVRFKPTIASTGNSQQGRVCSGPQAYNWSRVRIHLMLRRQGESLTTIYTTSASLDAYSTKINLPVLSGTTAPYVLEVMGIESDHRCKTEVYGNLSTAEKAACTAGNYWASIPLNTGGPTACVAVNLEFATDSTYDLP